jgi:DNA gyrase/topoisomerase IV subunit B
LIGCTMQVKARLVLFVSGHVENPEFDSQTKETLTTPAERFICTHECSSSDVSSWRVFFVFVKWCSKIFMS